MRVHPVQATIHVLSGKWKVQAVWRLSFGPLRFAELRNLLRGVSERFSPPSFVNWKRMVSSAEP